MKTSGSTTIMNNKIRSIVIINNIMVSTYNGSIHIIVSTVSIHNSQYILITQSLRGRMYAIGIA